MRDDDGRIVEIISSGNDITWRVEALKNLVESKKKYESSYRKLLILGIVLLILRVY